MRRFIRRWLTVRRIAMVCSFGLGVAASTLCHTVEENVSGKWSGSFEITYADGRVQRDTALLTLRQEGNSLTGTAGANEGQQSEITGGKVEGAEIHFKLQSANGINLIFSLRLEGGHLKGEVNGDLPDGKVKVKVDLTRANLLGTAHSLGSEGLHDEIAGMDAVLFAAFNSRNLEKLKTLFTEDLEFYHDRDGLVLYEQNMENFKRIFASATKVRRELVEGSLEVYPLGGFGAVEIGVHRFYSQEMGKKEYLSATAKFVHVWQKKNGEWRVSRVISYDHR